MHALFQRSAPSLCALALAAVVAAGPVWAQEASSPTKTESVSPPVSKREAQQAEDAYLAGVRLLDRGDLAGAETRFSNAAKLNPSRAEYLQAATLAHEHRVTSLVQQAGKARLLGHPEQSDMLLAEARRLDPENSIVTQHTNTAAPEKLFRPEIQAITPGDLDDVLPRSISSLAGPITLASADAHKSFQLHTDAQQVLRQIFSQYGIRTVFDESVEHQSLRIDLDDASYVQASSIALGMAHAFATPLDAHTVLIAKDTQENRDRFERLLQETIYIPGFTPEQMREMGTIVQNVFDLKKVGIQTNGGNLAVRAPEDTLSAINLTLADLVDGSAEVLLDISLYSVDRTRQRQIGAQLPQQLGIYNVESEAHNLVTANQSLVDQAIAQGLIPAGSNDITIALALIASGAVQSSLLANTVSFFGGGKTMSGVTTNASASFQFSLSSSDTRALDSIKLRLSDGQTGNFRSGTRYPIITSTYSTGVNLPQGALAGTTINGVSAQDLLNQASSLTVPQIQFEDLGLTLKAKPMVLKSGQVSLQIDLKIEALAGNSLNNIPILANRQYVSTLTVGDGESALMASSLSRTESAAVSGLPGISELPGFQTATADKTTETDTSELVLVFTPHVVRHRSNLSAGPRIAFEQRLPD